MVRTPTPCIYNATELRLRNVSSNNATALTEMWRTASISLASTIDPRPKSSHTKGASSLNFAISASGFGDSDYEYSLTGFRLWIFPHRIQIVSIPSPDSNVSIPSSDSNVSIPSSDSRCEYSLTGFKVSIPSPDSNVSIPPPDSKSEYSLIDSNCEYFLNEFKFSNCEYSLMDSDCELSLTRQIASFRSPDRHIVS
ncbi:hypothetical protein L195_g004197 [Trifolium pratense]|uniref:Uncharacterized protein n=1 Tax=Trifolium pratense TaxID=57577 RepID=A0A2K3NXD6_TRIPR|nr:hypothetical protein L195_g004197 [Trifolium pratense]